MAVFFQDFRSLNGERRQVIVEERDLYDSFLRDLIRQGQDEGIICPDIEPKLAAITVLGMMNWIYHWYKPGGELSADRDRERATPTSSSPGSRATAPRTSPGIAASSHRCRRGSRSSRATAPPRSRAVRRRTPASQPSRASQYVPPKPTVGAGPVPHLVRRNRGVPPAGFPVERRETTH